MSEIDLQADLDDRVSLAAFAELWWAEERARSDDVNRFVDNKQAAIRMLRSLKRSAWRVGQKGAAAIRARKATQRP